MISGREILRRKSNKYNNKHSVKTSQKKSFISLAFHIFNNTLLYYCSDNLCSSKTTLLEEITNQPTLFSLRFQLKLSLRFKKMTGKYMHIETFVYDKRGLKLNTMYNV